MTTIKTTVGRPVLLKAITIAVSGIEDAEKLLELINRDSNLTHSERKAMTALVIMSLKNVRIDTRHALDVDSIPF